MIRFALIAVLALVGCKQDNPDSCENPNSQHPLCTGIDAPEACPQACSGARPVCLDGECVECVSNDDCSTSANGPICSAEHTCGPCTAHSQCGSEVCLEDGTCANQDNVVYVAPDGPGPDCVLLRPCATVTDARSLISEARPILKITGEIIDTGVDLNNIDVTIHSDPGATLRRMTTNEILKVKGGSNVTIFDLTLAGASGTSGHGILIEDTTTNLRLERVVVRANRGNGIFTSGAGLLTIRRSIFAQNDRGGLAVSNLQFDITSSLFVANGATDSTIGGVQLSPGTGATRVFDFNTIADNTIETPSRDRGGMQCAGGAFTARANIVIVVGVGTIVLGGCSFEHSLFNGVTAPTGVGNRLGDPRFESVSLNDLATNTFYRIMDTSDAADQVPISVTAPMTDIDGEPRQQGPMFDIGADETK